MTGNASMDLPYSDESANIIYNLLFCDNLSLYQELAEQPYTYPFDILLASDVAITDLQKIAGSEEIDPRVKLLACNRLLAAGVKGNTRITFLVSDGLYFGEAKSNILFGDPMAGPALKVATNLMNHIIVKAKDH